MTADFTWTHHGKAVFWPSTSLHQGYCTIHPSTHPALPSSIILSNCCIRKRHHDRTLFSCLDTFNFGGCPDGFGGDGGKSWSEFVHWKKKTNKQATEQSHVLMALLGLGTNATNIFHKEISRTKLSRDGMEFHLSRHQDSVNWISLIIEARDYNNGRKASRRHGALHPMLLETSKLTNAFTEHLFLDFFLLLTFLIAFQQVIHHQAQARKEAEAEPSSSQLVPHAYR